MTDSVDLNNQHVLKPTMNSSRVHTIQKLSNKLKSLISINEQHNEVSQFLNKSLRYLNSAISNEELDNHFAAYRCLKSAGNNLVNFLADCSEQSDCLLDAKTSGLLQTLVAELNACSDELEKLTLVESDAETAGEVAIAPLTNMNMKNVFNSFTNSAAGTEAGAQLNDWVVSEFNLTSNDFNNELQLISGTLFDLDYNYQVCRRLQLADCLLMKQRHLQAHDQPGKRFILKVH